MWVSAEEALRKLRVKPQTLYASVSRGRIAARPDPVDPRRSLYRAEDVDRLAARTRGRPSVTAVAAEAIDWGAPVMPSSISAIIDGRLIYRGHDAVLLSRTATLEETAELLWGGWSDLPAVGAEQGSVLTALAKVADRQPTTIGQGQVALREQAAVTLSTVAAALLGPGSGRLHDRVARRFDRADAADLFRRTVVVLAEHELNASTFAARVTVSTGASLAAGALAGLAALTGPRHGRAAGTISALAEDIGDDPAAAEPALLDWLAEGRAVPGFGHRLYPAGDVRAAELLAQIPMSPAFAALATAAESITSERPNVDFALAALTASLDLPPSAPMSLFTLGRTVGWLAHMIEQAQSGAVIRPRARYTGLSAS